MKISNEEVGRIMQLDRINRATVVRTRGYGRPVEPRITTPASSVELSDSALEIQRVKSIVDNLPDVREDLVQSLKARVESGTYTVKSEDIADLIVRRAWADSMR